MSAPLRVVILLPCSDSDSAHVALDTPVDPERHLPQHRWERVVLRKATAQRDLALLARRDVDVFVNLCDGAWDEDRPGIDVVRALQELELAYTGASAAVFDPSREVMKMAAWSAGVSIPRYVTVEGPDDLPRAAALPFPLLVKHPRGYNSVGLSPASRVSDPAALEAQVRAALASWGGALVEQFIEGREFTVLVTEPREGESEPWALQPVEFRFPPGETWKHFDLKWVRHREMEAVPVEDPALAEALRRAARGTFTALGSDGYARLDLRMGDDGVLVLLEINANPSIFYGPGDEGSADFILALEPGGASAFLQHQLDRAIARQRAGAARVRASFDPEVGFGLVARRAIAQGEVVLPGEEQPLRLVSRDHVARRWDARQRGWFDAYAWPVSDAVWAFWSRDPADWRPINHSCDPTCWLDGLDLVARRPLAADDAVTMDYGTFCGPGMAAFDCRCGAAECRGRVGPEDLLDEPGASRYGSHVSAWVAAAQRGRRS